MSEGLQVAEFVFPGHPDKICDAIADALVAEALRREGGRSSASVAIHSNRVFVTGRIACRDAATIEVDTLVRMSTARRAMTPEVPRAW
jgi:S-adenosylmethionine synthetase